MSNKFTGIDTRNQTYYFYDDIIIIKIFGLNNIIIDEKSYRNILVYYIGYMAIKGLKYVRINNINPLYLIISRGNEHFEETIVPTNENKEKRKNMKNCGVKSKI